MSAILENIVTCCLQDGHGSLTHASTYGGNITNPRRRSRLEVAKLGPGPTLTDILLD